MKNIICFFLTKNREKQQDATNDEAHFSFFLLFIPLFCQWWSRNFDPGDVFRRTLAMRRFCAAHIWSAKKKRSKIEFQRGWARKKLVIAVSKTKKIYKVMFFFYAKNNRHSRILPANSFERLLKCGVLPVYYMGIEKKWCAKRYLGEKNRHRADERVKESNEPISLTFGATRHLLIIISRHYNNHERSDWGIWKKNERRECKYFFGKRKVD